MSYQRCKSAVYGNLSMLPSYGHFASLHWRDALEFANRVLQIHFPVKKGILQLPTYLGYQVPDIFSIYICDKMGSEEERAWIVEVALHFSFFFFLFTRKYIFIFQHKVALAHDFWTDDLNADVVLK